jgi:hypothetical protein
VTLDLDLTGKILQRLLVFLSTGVEHEYDSSRKGMYRLPVAFRMTAFATQKNGGSFALTSKRMSNFRRVLFHSSTEGHQ